MHTEEYSTSFLGMRKLLISSRNGLVEEYVTL